MIACHKPKRAGSPFIYCHSNDCEHKYDWQCGIECHGERTPCRKWHGATTEKGYSVRKENQEYLYEHRVRWEKAFGPIPEGKYLSNVCGTRNCVNPRHWRLSREAST